MKSKLTLGLALVLSGGVFGCSTAGKKTLDYSTADSSQNEGEVLKGLGNRLAIRVAADSWPELLEKIKPAFVYRGCDLLWIERDKHGQPQFVLDEAFVYQPTNQPRQWVLLEANYHAPYDEYYGAVMGRNLRGIANLQASVPPPVSDAEIYGDYAIVLSANHRLGAVYEIGWQQLMANGSCLCENNRRLYLFKDRAGHWYFLGEGPGVGHGKGGSNDSNRYDVTASVVWQTNRIAKIPCEVNFVMQDEEMQWSGPDGDASEDRSLVTYTEAALAGKFPTQLRTTSERPYLLAETNDTVEKISDRIGYFQPGWEYWPKEMQASKKRHILEMWTTGIAELNPQLPKAGNVKAGTRIQLLNYDERDARLNTLGKTKSK